MRKTSPGISGELCRIVTEDGLELNGVYVGTNQKSETRNQKSEMRGPDPSPESLAPSPLCLVHVHGWDGNFYENRFIDYAAEACARRGIASVSGNNRGHDYIADILRSRTKQKPETRNQKLETAEKFDYVQMGGMYEKLADCVPDIRAWIDFAIARGARQVILQGHSHGAIKVVHYLVTTEDPRVSGLVLLSPSDDMGWAKKLLGERFQWVLSRAREMVRTGNGRKMMPERDFPYPVSAQTFFDCYRKDSIAGMFNISRTNRTELPELAAIKVPVLLAVGTVEEYYVGNAQGFVDGVGECLESCPSFTGLVIEGAPHNYLGHEKVLAEELQRWLRERTEDG